MDIYSDSDLKDLWDTELETMHCDSMLRLSGPPPSDAHDLPDWYTERGVNDRQVLHVILNDKLMTDALLGGAPIKREHSYSGNSQEKTDENNNTRKTPQLSSATSHSSLSDLELDIKREPNSCPPSPCPAPFPLPPTPPADAPKYARQPIHTALISQQPKGGVGDLQLTDEEKRTLVAEGYAVPHRMPLTKAEEKSLKKVRRKIKNKISAQESRRKKKEYMDQLEKRVERLATENGGFRRRVDILEDENRTLLGQLQHMKLLVQRTNQ